MLRPRDNQRSRVYAWERACIEKLAHSDLGVPDFATLEECASFADPIWVKERGRVGLARQEAPSIERPHRGQRRGYAHADHRITLPKWTRSRWYILHELAHRLTPHDEAHGPRFVGVLIGLVSRWLEYDTQQLMALADEMGVRYFVRSVGVVPVRGPAWHVERAVRMHGPMTLIDLSCHLSLAEGQDLTPPQVRGAALHLIKACRARWLRKKLVLIGDAAPKAPEPPKPPRPKRPAPRNKQQQARALAERIGAEIECDGHGCTIWVYPPDGLFTSDEDDPFQVDGHYCDEWAEALERVKVYEQRKYPGGIAPDNPGENK